MQKHSALIILLGILAFVPLDGQNKHLYNNRTALPWVTGEFPENFDKIRYKVVMGEGMSYNAACDDATRALLLEIGWENGITVKSKTVDEIIQRLNDTESMFEQNRTTTTEIEQDGFKASLMKIDEYTEADKLTSDSNGCKVWQLYAIDSPYSNIHLEYTRKYGWRAGLRSILPGWGQYYKKQYAKGSIFLAAEVGGVAAICIFQNRYRSNLRKIQETPVLDLRLEYNKRANDALLYRNISIGAVAAVWIWNILDAALTDGPPRYITDKIEFSVSSVSHNDIGVRLSYKF